MSSIENPTKESSSNQPQKNPKPRRSSLKSGSGNNLDPNNLLKLKAGVRHSVSFGQSNTFQFKAMKAMFQESYAAEKPKQLNDEEHKKFLDDRKKSVKDEFSIVKEMMKNDKKMIEEIEDSDEEVKKNTDKNVKIGHEALNEIESDSNSGSSENEKENNK